MSTRQHQSDFALAVSHLIQKAYELGYEVTLGDAYRDPRVHGKFGEKKSYSHSRSNHKLRLAIDLNLFKNGKYLSTTEAHRELGEWWEAEYDKARWGGNFRRADGNHYEWDVRR